MLKAVARAWVQVGPFCFVFTPLFPYYSFNCLLLLTSLYAVGGYSRDSSSTLLPNLSAPTLKISLKQAYTWRRYAVRKPIPYYQVLCLTPGFLV